MTRKPLVAGNWKMNTGLDDAIRLAGEVNANAPAGVDLVVFPPFPWLVAVSDALRDGTVGVGAQNCWTEPAGAFTGEVSPEMLSVYCSHVIVGHSERRTILGESDELIARKVRAALRAGLSPVLCIGESLAVRKTGEAEAFVAAQIHAALDGLSSAELSACVIAYEPIWAIGTGVSASVDEIQGMSAAIRAVLGSIDEAGRELRILYGGSVSPANFGEIRACPDVDGALVGGASLKAESFLALARIAAN